MVICGKVVRSSFVEALMKILVYMRDQGIFCSMPIRSVNIFIYQLESIVLIKNLSVMIKSQLAFEDAPDVVLEPITNYLLTLPGFDKAKKANKCRSI